MVGSSPGDRRTPRSTSTEAALDLLDATSRPELSRAVRRLVDDAARSAGAPLPEPTVRTLVDALTATAERTLPLLYRPPRDDAAVAARVYGLESEGLSPEDRDYAVARQFVRLVRAAAARAAHTPGQSDARRALAFAARRLAPGLAHVTRPARSSTPFTTATPDRKGRHMFDVRTQETGYGRADHPDRRRRDRSYGDEEGEQYGQAEADPREAEGQYGEAEGQYGEAEGQYGEGPYGEWEGEYGEAEGEYGEGPYGEAEGEYEQYGQGEGEQEQYGEGEERFLPLIPIVGKVLGGVLGGLLKEAEAGEYGEGEYGEGGGGGEVGEAEERFLHKILGRILGEAEHDEAALTPAQESRFAAELTEITNEQEMEGLLGRIINTVGRAVQGIQGAARSPQGRALIETVRPLAKAALPALGGPVGAVAGALLEAEAMEAEGEQQEFELARRVVRLTGAAARDVALAPPDAPPQLVGEFSVYRGYRSFRGPLYRSTLRAISPFARRYYGRRYSTFRRYGYPGRRSWGGYRRYGYAGPPSSGYRSSWPGARPYGYGPSWGTAQPPEPADPGPAQPPEPPPAQPPPPRPGYRWVAVPIGAPDPASGPPPSTPPPDASGGSNGQGEFGDGPDGHGSAGRNGHGRSGRWVRRDGKIVLLGA